MINDHEMAVANTHIRQTLLAIKQVLGEKGANDIYQAAQLDTLQTSLPADDMSHSITALEYAHLLQVIDATYGKRGARILQRIGRASFHIVLREQPTLMTLAKTVMGIWSQERRIQFMMETIVETQRKTYPHAEIWLEEKNGKLAYIEQNCLACHQRQSSHPVCFLTTGFIDEALQWVTGKELKIIETHCIAVGDAYCRFEVGKEIPQKDST